MNIYTERKILMKACEAVSLFCYVYVKAVVRTCERKTFTIFYSIFADALCVSDEEEEVG